MAPLFTLAIPTYNREAMLAEALRSALSQTFDDYEVIVRDNASTDGTAELVQGLASQRLRYLRNAANVGCHRNFQLLADDARGEFLVFLQDDDLLHPDFLARAARALKGRPGVVLYAAYVAGATRQVPQSWALTDPVWGPELPTEWDQSGPRYWPGPLASVQCLVQTGLLFPALAFRTELCRKYMPWDLSLGNAADRYFTGCLATEGLVAVEPWVAGIYRIHAGQTTNAYGDYGPNMIRSARKLLDFYEAHAIDWRGLIGAWLAGLPFERRQAILHYATSVAYPDELQETVASALGQAPPASEVCG